MGLLFFSFVYVKFVLAATDKLGKINETTQFVYFLRLMLLLVNMTETIDFQTDLEVGKQMK